MKTFSVFISSTIEDLKSVRSNIDERLQQGSFDVVMAFYVLHFFEDIDAVFKRVHELLIPGGFFITETSCLGDGNFIVGKLLRLVGIFGFMPKINLLTTRQLEQALETAGFSIVEKKKFSDSNSEYTLFAKKKPRGQIT